MERKSKIKALAVVVFSLGIIFSTLMIFPGDKQLVTETPIVITPERDEWVILGDQIVNDPALGDNSGICGFYIFEADNTYTANLTAGAGYVSGGTAINATEIDFNHTIMQDLIVWARFNVTDSGLDVQFTRCNMTWAGNITYDQAPDQTHVTYAGAKFIYVNYVWEDKTCYRNQQDIEITDIIIQGYK